MLIGLPLQYSMLTLWTDFKAVQWPDFIQYILLYYIEHVIYIIQTLQSTDCVGLHLHKHAV